MPGFKNRSLLGQRGEHIAASYLEKNGYQIRERNFRCNRGEIDLIADQEEYLVFVEVKSRYESKPAVSPFISLTKAKCNRIRLLGKTYLVKHNIRSKQPRFDVIGIVFQNEDRYSLEHIKNAF